jgi:hypothetical protein
MRACAAAIACCMQWCALHACFRMHEPAAAAAPRLHAPGLQACTSHAILRYTLHGISHCRLWSSCRRRSSTACTRIGLSTSSCGLQALWTRRCSQTLCIPSQHTGPACQLRAPLKHFCGPCRMRPGTFCCQRRRCERCVLGGFCGQGCRRENRCHSRFWKNEFVEVWRTLSCDLRELFIGACNNALRWSFLALRLRTTHGGHFSAVHLLTSSY